MLPQAASISNSPVKALHKLLPSLTLDSNSVSFREDNGVKTSKNMSVSNNVSHNYINYTHNQTHQLSQIGRKASRINHTSLNHPAMVSPNENFEKLKEMLKLKHQLKEKEKEIKRIKNDAHLMSMFDEMEALR